MGLFIATGSDMPANPVAYVLQGIVFVIAVSLIFLATLASRKAWMR